MAAEETDKGHGPAGPPDVLPGRPGAVHVAEPEPSQWREPAAAWGGAGPPFAALRGRRGSSATPQDHGGLPKASTGRARAVNLRHSTSCPSVIDLIELARSRLLSIPAPACNSVWAG